MIIRVFASNHHCSKQVFQKLAINFELIIQIILSLIGQMNTILEFKVCRISIESQKLLKINFEKERTQENYHHIPKTVFRKKGFPEKPTINLPN
jgi:hypothetical protein